jgi:hypothetical protein
MHNSEIRKLPQPKRLTAYLKNCRQDTLANRIAAGIELSEKQIQSGVSLLGHGCQQRKKNMIKWALMACPNLLSYGIYDRVHINGNNLSYCAGQSYPDEIRTVRECLVGR